MKFKIVITAIMLMLAFPAAADFVTSARAYELVLSDLTVPPSQNSKLMFKECDDCDYMSIRLTPNTQFKINGRNVRFDQFREAIRGVRNADETMTIVLHHLESDTVKSVSVTIK
jgi:hypothetical protein